MNPKSEMKMSNHGWTQMDTDENSSKPVQAFPTRQVAMHMLNVLILAVIHVHPCPSVSIRGFNFGNQDEPSPARILPSFVLPRFRRG